MTATHLTQVPGDRAAPHGTAHDPLTPVAGPARSTVTVTTVVVTQGRTPYLQATLDAVAAQGRTPDEVVVVDVDAAESTALHTDLKMGERRYVGAAGARTLGEAVDRALTAGSAEPSTWVWVLHDDSAPAPDTLARLLRAVEHSAAIAVAGCKQRLWPLAADGRPEEIDPRRPGVLLSVGYTVSPLGRRMTGLDDTEIDQGQHDAREDVLAVGLAGALVRRSVWTELGGTDPELGRFGDSLDLCRRARLAGHRVVVVPDAVVHHAQASLRGLRGHRDRAGMAVSAYGRRRSQLYQRLVDVPLPVVPLAMLAMLLWAPFAAAYRLVLKQPGRVRDELLAPLVTVLRFVPLVRGRRRAARSRRLPRRVLQPLRGTWRQVAADRRDARLARSEAHRVRWVPTDLERAELRALRARRRTGLAVVLTAVVALCVLALGSWQGPLLDGGRVVGGALLPAAGGLAETWTAASSGWVRDGLGTPAPADPLLLVLTALTVLVGGSTQTAVNVLVVAALPLAALGGWFAAGAVTRVVWARAVAAMVWTASPMLLVALGEGRVGALIAHLTLPWVLVGAVRAVGAQARDDVARPDSGHGSLGAAAAAGLALCVAVCAAPVLLPLAAVVAVAGLLAAGPHRWRLLLVLLPSVVVPLPLWWHLVATWSDGGWRLMFAEPGEPVPTAAPDGLAMLLGWPRAPEPWPASGVGTLDLAGTAGPWLLGGGVLLLAVVALFARRQVVAVRYAWTVAVLALGAALVAVGTVVAAGDVEGEVAAVHGWPGASLSVLLLALGTAALRVTPAPAHRWTRGLAALLTAVALAVPTGTLAMWWYTEARGESVGMLEARTDPVVPAVGQQMQAPGRAARVVQLDRAADGAVVYTVMHADGTSLLDSSVTVRAREAGLVPGPTRTDLAALDELVAQVAAGRAPDLVDRLAALGVGAVQLPPGGDAELATTLDLVAGLTRVTEEGTRVWRVAPDGPLPAWAGVAPSTAAASSTTLWSDGTRVDDDVTSGAQDRVLVLAESAGGGWRATVGGQRLTALEVDGLQAFDLGERTGHVEVSYGLASRLPWFVLGALVLGTYVLLALPVARRRSR